MKMTKKILVVDDQVDVVIMLQIALEHEGYEVQTALSGPAALESVSGVPPDLIVLDGMMPIMDGFEVLERLKENPATASIPTIMLTAMDTQSAMEEGWEKGVDLYLTKPFRPTELASLVKCILHD